MYFVRIDDKVFTLSATSLKYLNVLDQITKKEEYSNDPSEYIDYDTTTKTFTVDADHKTFAVFIGAIRNNAEDI